MAWARMDRMIRWEPAVLLQSLPSWNQCQGRAYLQIRVPPSSFQCSLKAHGTLLWIFQLKNMRTKSIFQMRSMWHQVYSKLIPEPLRMCTVAWFVFVLCVLVWRAYDEWVLEDMINCFSSIGINTTPFTTIWILSFSISEFLHLEHGGNNNVYLGLFDELSGTIHLKGLAHLSIPYRPIYSVCYSI